MSKTFEALSAQQQEKEQQQKKQELKQELTTTTAMSPPTVPETPEELQAELARFREAAARNSRVSFLGKIGRFVKGDWLLGAEKEKIPDKTRWIGIMSRAQHGYIEWVDADDGTDKRVPVHHYLGRIGEGHAPPPRASLGRMDQSQWKIGLNKEPEDPLKEVVYLPLLSLDGEKAWPVVVEKLVDRLVDHIVLIPRWGIWNPTYINSLIRSGRRNVADHDDPADSTSNVTQLKKKVN